jgi:hypothetical protein
MRGRREVAMFSISLDALKQAMGIVAGSSKDGSDAVSKPAMSAGRKTKKLQSKALRAVVSLTQKVGGPVGE